MNSEDLEPRPSNLENFLAVLHDEGPKIGLNTKQQRSTAVALSRAECPAARREILQQVYDKKR